MRFRLLSKIGRARYGQLIFNRGIVDTPNFIPVGTYGAIKGLNHDDLNAGGVEIILSNTFHLLLRPGLNSIIKHGGLHNFIQWKKPILTDSGGFQVFSFVNMIKIIEEGVYFNINGKNIFIGPEESVLIQRILGSDIIMIFDYCPPYPMTYKNAKTSMELSLRWAKRSHYAHVGSRSALFGIIQGSIYRKLRERSLLGLMDIGFDGLAIGGLSVGEPKQEMIKVLNYLPMLMPDNKPRYLMGVGKPEDLVEGVCRGIDIFDCVIPTRNARNGHLYTFKGIINIRNSKHKHSNFTVEKYCDCYTCKYFSRSYLHHLYHCKDILGAKLNTIHNIRYYQRLMANLRNAIKNGTLDYFVSDFYKCRMH
ncbi:Queuine tRNA-ribosyltransferase [Candidatus Johnevansia muelleri]|uniref:Queuine tRNA-ribosyltransferase n=1 Tax=Candidatus Johnevansia muelleri TaxID=1495769 RepID=A0A078KB76_9GAMM|nr:Queuine tRNA-ribosyltransferase [Candidatus Evansia muelleri]